MEEKNFSYVCHLTRTCSFAPYLQWDKIKISYLKWCFCPLWVWLMLFLKGKYWERRSVFFSGLVLYNCARQCQTLLPAEMTLGTRSSCANTAALLSTHLHSGWAKSNYLPCLEPLFSSFISVVHIQLPSAVHTSWTARPNKADKCATVGTFLLYFSHVNIPLLVSLISQPFPHFSPQASGVTVGIHFFWRSTTKVNREGMWAARSSVSWHWRRAKKKMFMSEESIPYENLSTQLCYLKWPLLLQFDLLPKGLTVYEDIPNSNDLNIATGNKQNFTGLYGGVSTPPPSQNRYVWLYKTKSCFFSSNGEVMPGTYNFNFSLWTQYHVWAYPFHPKRSSF